MAYCIRAPGYKPPSPDPTTTSGPTPPAPTHTGQPANCNKWHVVEEGDTCSSVPAKYGITLKQFLEWNPAVSSDCVDNFWLGQAYCVGVSSSTPPPPTTTSAGPPVPTPTQPGNAVPACNDYGQAQDGDTCGVFADRHGISLQQLYTWNKLLKEDGSGCATSFWSGYWYCIGVVVKSQRKPVIQL